MRNKKHIHATRALLSEQKVIPAMMAIEAPLDDGEDSVEGERMDEEEDMVGG